MPQPLKNPKIIIFSTPTCSWCRRAKDYFRKRRIQFKDVDVSKNASAAKDLVRISGQQGVPVILINNRPIVGFDQRKIESIIGRS